MGNIRHIFIASERGGPMRSVPEVAAVAECGLTGDRYADAKHRKSPDCQVTLIELEQIDAFVAQSGLPLAPHEPRRNLVTVGVSLNELQGKRFVVGGAELEGLELCEPCATFAGRTHREVLRAFVRRGGLRCRIIRSGVIRAGDVVTPVA